jgi:hypothetical protein
VDAIIPLVDENRDRCVRGSIGHHLRHFLHDERIPDHEAEHPGPLPGSLFAQDIAGVEADELHQSEAPIAPCTTASSSATVVAAATASWNAFISG